MKRAHGFSNAAHDCVQNNVLKHSLGKFCKNVAWFNQGWTRTRGSINCQPTLDRADEFLHFCGRSIFCCPLIDFPNLDWNSIRITGRPFCSRTTLFCKTSSDVDGHKGSVCFAFRAARASAERKSRAIPIIIIFFPRTHWSLSNRMPQMEPRARALAFHHMLCR